MRRQYSYTVTVRYEVDGLRRATRGKVRASSAERAVEAMQHEVTRRHTGKLVYFHKSNAVL